MQELSVFSRIASVLNVECVMWMWCRSWSLQIEVRTKQTAGEQGISPSVMKAKDSGMDCAPRGRKRKMGRYVMIDSEGKRERGGLIQADSHCSGRRTSSACHMCMCWGGCWINSPGTRSCSRYSSVVCVCVCVCSAGAPSFKQEIVSHCSLSIKNQLPQLNECHGQSTEDVQERRVSRPREFDSF